MSDENKESKIKVEDLAQPEQELTDEEAKKVQGGAFTGGVRVATGDVNGDGSVKSGPHVKVFDGRTGAE